MRSPEAKIHFHAIVSLRDQRGVRIRGWSATDSSACRAKRLQTLLRRTRARRQTAPARDLPTRNKRGKSDRSDLCWPRWPVRQDVAETRARISPAIVPSGVATGGPTPPPTSGCNDTRTRGTCVGQRSVHSPGCERKVEVSITADQPKSGPVCSAIARRKRALRSRSARVDQADPVGLTSARSPFRSP